MIYEPNFVLGVEIFIFIIYSGCCYDLVKAWHDLCLRFAGRKPKTKKEKPCAE